jgi:hypothetical protein
LLKVAFNFIVFALTGAPARTHDLPHLRRAC